MTLVIPKSRIWVTILVVVMSFGCVKDRSFDAPRKPCTTESGNIVSYAEVKALYVGETIQIQDDLIIEGYVISSDREGNFFGSLHFQDGSERPEGGFQLDFDIRDSHLFYPVGSKISIKLKGLYLGKKQGVYKLGGVFTSFGNLYVGRLPANVVSQHLFISCDGLRSIAPVQSSIHLLEERMVNTLVQLDDVEIVENELGLPFAELKEETERTLIDCNGNGIILLNSGYSNFRSTVLPEGRGSVVGVLLKGNNGYKLAIRDLYDIDLQKERCAELIDEFTSNSIFISELADPNNNSGARFVELYNAGTEVLSLNGWSLNRFTNGNTEISSKIDLSGHEIGSGSTFLISPNISEFNAVYGFEPDFGVGTNSPADSNGDDNLQLVDPFGTVIDTFGTIGEDGSGTDHEFEDGRALRKPNITQANPVYTFDEWIVFNDTGASGTTDQPQNAPENFSPGIR
ncbi:MAG: nuclease [Maribacter sp.]|nr:MAG: nuclease [Maribacter sp.]